MDPYRLVLEETQRELEIEDRYLSSYGPGEVGDNMRVWRAVLAELAEVVRSKQPVSGELVARLSPGQLRRLDDCLRHCFADAHLDIEADADSEPAKRWLAARQQALDLGLRGEFWTFVKLTQGKA